MTRKCNRLSPSLGNGLQVPSCPATKANLTVCHTHKKPASHTPAAQQRSAGLYRVPPVPQPSRARLRLVKAAPHGRRCIINECHTLWRGMRIRGDWVSLQEATWCYSTLMKDLEAASKGTLCRNTKNALHTCTSSAAACQTRRCITAPPTPQT